MPVLTVLCCKNKCSYVQYRNEAYNTVRVQWRYCEFIGDVASSVAILRVQWRYCEFSDDIASSVTILRVQWRYCEYSGDIASSVLSFWHLTVTKIYSSS